MRINSTYKETLAVAALVLLDIASYYLSLFMAYYSRILLSMISEGITPLQFNLHYFILFWWIPLVFLFSIAYEGLYYKRMPFWDETREMIKIITIATIIIFAVMSIGKFSQKMSRLTIILLFFWSIVVFPIMRLMGKRVLYLMGIWKENLIIIGAGKTGVEVAEGLGKESHLGYNIVGFLDDDPKKIGRIIKANGKKFKIFGKVKNFSKFISLMDIKTVIVAIPSISLAELSRLTENVQKSAKRILLVPDLKGIALVNTEMRHLSAQQMFMLKINNNLKSDFNRFVKKSFDYAFSILLLPFLLFMLVVFGIWIAVDSKGGVFLLQDRIGRNGKIFKCIKFRTMYINADEILSNYLHNSGKAQAEWNKYKKLRDYDPRVTHVGKFLRKTSLDELPQIINVLSGDMSFFGPRPYLPEEENEISDYADLILITNPGITGLWQVSGRNILDFEERVKLDVWYVLNWSLWLDIVILFKTIAVVLKKEGAY